MLSLVSGLLQYDVGNLSLKKQKKTSDRTLLVLILLLTAVGLVAVADASAPLALSTFGDKFYFVKQQAIWGVFGLILLFIFSNIHYSFWEKIATPLFFLSLALLVAVLIPGIGVKFLGARRWIILGSISIQPSEIIKLTLVIYLAKVARRIKSPLSYFLPLALVAGLIMLQPDLGTTLVIVFSSLSQIFISGVSLFYFLAASLTGVAASFLLIIFSSYRRERLLTFLKVTQDPLGRDYHIRQILLALGSGGIFGVGLGQSHQKFLFLPEAPTDSIFAIVAEELGFVGASILISLFALFVYRALLTVKNAPDKFAQVLACGITAWIGGQALLNIGSMAALVPLTGIPLPFFSYGGSSLTMILLACGILLNISKEGNAK